jgi:hypothetical protein
VSRGRPGLPGVNLAEFVASAPELSIGQRALVVDVASALLEEVYVHLPQKRARYGIDPVQQLRLLRQRIADLAPGELREQVTTILAGLHDRHTGYLAPAPWAGKAATLPFLVERFVDEGQPRYLVSKLADWGDVPADFEPGVEVVSWSGVPIDRAVERNALRQRGANPAARTARGLQALTVRSLSHSLPPDEHWVDVAYRTRRRAQREFRFEWRVLDVVQAPTADQPGPHAAHDPGGLAVLQVRRELFAAPRVERPWLATTMPDVVAARPLRAAGGAVGHLRLWSFAHNDDVGFVAEVARLLALLPRRGVIIDVRGNPGGAIPSAERLLQLLAPGPFEPARFSLATTPTTLTLCRADPDGLGPWAPSIRTAVGTGDPYSLGLPITPVAPPA